MRAYHLCAQHRINPSRLSCDRIKRLVLGANDGAAFLNSTVSFGEGKTRTVPGLSTLLRKQRDFDGVGIDLFQLIGELYCADPMFMDRVVVALALCYVRELRAAPQYAATEALARLTYVVGKHTVYQQDLAAALLHRYATSGEEYYNFTSPHPSLVIAIYQQLQLPFRWYYHDYPVPLHFFPELDVRPGVVRNTRIFSRARERDCMEAKVTVWLSVLRWWTNVECPDGLAKFMDVFNKISIFHRVLVLCHASSWHLTAPGAISKATNKMMEIKLRYSLLCSE